MKKYINNKEKYDLLELLFINEISRGVIFIISPIFIYFMGIILNLLFPGLDYIDIIINFSYLVLAIIFVPYGGYIIIKNIKYKKNKILSDFIDKVIIFFGFVSRGIFFLGITYFLIKYIDLRNISEIPISKITLGDIGKVILNMFIIYIFIGWGLLNIQTNIEKERGDSTVIDYKNWAKIGISIIIIGFYIGVYMYNSGK